MAHGITGIDHTLVGVKDLTAAGEAWRRLGFTLTPRGSHIGWGTANHCIMFPDDYVELIGIVDPAAGSNNLDAWLARRGEGLFGIALSTADVERSLGDLTASGIQAQQPRRLARDLALPEGPARPEFQVMNLPDDATPGLTAFLCQHLSPGLLRRPEWLRHANGCCGIAAVITVVEHPPALAQAYEALFGAGSTAMTDQTLSVMAGDSMLIFVRPSDLDVFFPGLDLEDMREVPQLAAMILESADPETAAAYFRDQGVRFTFGEGGSVRVAPEEACGVLLEFAPLRRRRAGAA